MFDTYGYMIEQSKYMLSRFSMLFSDMYASRPQRAQLECGRGDDGFGNIVNKNLEGYRATLIFLES